VGIGGDDLRLGSLMLALFHKLLLDVGFLLFLLLPLLLLLLLVGGLTHGGSPLLGELVRRASDEWQTRGSVSVLLRVVSGKGDGSWGGDQGVVLMAVERLRIGVIAVSEEGWQGRCPHHEPAIAKGDSLRLTTLNVRAVNGVLVDPRVLAAGVLDFALAWFGGVGSTTEEAEDAAVSLDLRENMGEGLPLLPYRRCGRRPRGVTVVIGAVLVLLIEVVGRCRLTLVAHECRLRLCLEACPVGSAVADADEDEGEGDEEQGSASEGDGEEPSDGHAAGGRARLITGQQSRRHRGLLEATKCRDSGVRSSIMAAAGGVVNGSGSRERHHRLESVKSVTRTNVAGKP
jgi:hypothetical protein